MAKKIVLEGFLTAAGSQGHGRGINNHQLAGQIDKGAAGGNFNIQNLDGDKTGLAAGQHVRVTIEVSDEAPAK